MGDACSRIEARGARSARMRASTARQASRFIERGEPSDGPPVGLAPPAGGAGATLAAVVGARIAAVAGVGALRAAWEASRKAGAMDVTEADPCGAAGADPIVVTE